MYSGRQKISVCGWYIWERLVMGTVLLGGHSSRRICPPRPRYAEKGDKIGPGSYWVRCGGPYRRITNDEPKFVKSWFLAKSRGEGACRGVIVVPRGLGPDIFSCTLVQIGQISPQMQGFTY